MTNEERKRRKAEKFAVYRAENIDRVRAIWRAYYQRNKARLNYRRELRSIGVDPDTIPGAC